MPQQIINVGTGPNSATGDPIRTAFQKCNNNFTSLFTGGIGTGSVVSIGITSSTLTVTGSPVTTSGTINIEAPPASISNPTLANMPAISVKANPTSAPGQPQDFVASGANQVLQVNASGTALQWGPFGTGVQVRGVTYSGGGAAIIVANMADVSILNPTDSVITRVSILTKGGTGSCQLDVWTSPIGSYPPIPANTIFTVLPTISGGISYDDTVLSGLSTTHIPAGNVLTFHLVSSSAFTEIVLNLAMVPTQSIVSTGYTDAQAVAAVKAAMSNTGNVISSGATGVITQNYTPPAAQVSVGTNGYIGLGAGIILRWGTFTLPASGDVTVTFPVAFPANCFSCVTSQGDSASYGYPFAVSNLSRTGFTAHQAIGGINAGTGYYIAVGN
jgi:hypothetical protein